MAKDGIKLMLDDGGRGWPLAVPRALFTVYQPMIGGTATLVWLNLYEMTGRPHESGDRPEDSSDDPVAVLSGRLGVSASDVNDALNVLERARLLERDDHGFSLRWPDGRVPDDVQVAEAAVARVEPGAAEPAAAVHGAAHVDGSAGVDGHVAGRVDVDRELDGDRSAAVHRAGDIDATAGGNVPDTAHPAVVVDEVGLKAVVAFYHQRIGMLGPSQFEKLRFWVEEMGMAADVVALAIEETVQNARTPRMNYLEAVLKNWYNDGIRTVADLQGAKRARSSALPQRSEGAPNAAAYETIDPDAVRRWKEMYADEYDG